MIDYKKKYLKYKNKYLETKKQMGGMNPFNFNPFNFNPFNFNPFNLEFFNEPPPPRREWKPTFRRPPGPHSVQSLSPCKFYSLPNFSIEQEFSKEVFRNRADVVAASDWDPEKIRIEDGINDFIENLLKILCYLHNSTEIDSKTYSGEDDYILFNWRLVRNNFIEALNTSILDNLNQKDDIYIYIKRGIVYICFFAARVLDLQKEIYTSLIDKLEILKDKISNSDSDDKFKTLKTLETVKIENIDFVINCLKVISGLSLKYYDGLFDPDKFNKTVFEDEV